MTQGGGGSPAGWLGRWVDPDGGCASPEGTLRAVRASFCGSFVRRFVSVGVLV